jgi:PAS domain S-box-containing protein
VGERNIVAEANPPACLLLGLPEGAAAGCRLARVLPVDHPGGWSGVLRRVDKEGSWRGEVAVPRPLHAAVRPAGRRQYLVVLRPGEAARDAQSALTRRLRYEAGVAACSKELLASGSPGTALPAALRRLLEAIQASRAYLFENHRSGDALLCRQVHEVCAPGVTSQADNPLLQALPYTDSTSGWAARLAAGKPLRARTQDLTGKERELLASQDVKSMLVLPVFMGGQWWGFVGFDDTEVPRDWDDEDVRLLVLATELVGSYLGRVQAKEALRRSEAFYRSIIENSSEGVAVLDGQGVVRYRSPSTHRILGLEPAEMVGFPMGQFVHAEDRDRLAQEFARVMAEPGRSARMEARFLHRDGTCRHVEGTARNLLQDPVVGGVVVNYRDITERREAETNRRSLEDQLSQAQKMEAVGRLAGGVAHDFNNILTGINGYAQILLASVKEGDPAKADLQQIMLAVERASNLTGQLLAFSRKQVIAPRLLDLNRVVEGCTKMLRRLVGEDVEVELDLAPSLPSVRADPHQLEQLLANLSVNARDAMPAGGRVVVRTEQVAVGADTPHPAGEVSAGTYVRLSVLDSGSGMPPHVLAHLFEPFFTTKTHGTGLGLATVYGVVRQNGGFITVSSEIGSGTCFRVHLPVAREPELETTLEAAPADLPRGRETILLVEDEEMVRVLARRVLERQGYRVLEAINGNDAMAVAQGELPRVALLVTDVVMPQLNGRQLHQRLKLMKPSLKVLYVSGYSEDVIAHQGVLEPGTDLLLKPFSVEELARRVREVLDRPDPVG